MNIGAPVAKLQQVAFMKTVRETKWWCSNKLVDLEIYYHRLKSVHCKRVCFCFIVCFAIQSRCFCFVRHLVFLKCVCLFAGGIW